MENTFVELLSRALHSVNPLMGDGSRLVTDEYCELCRSIGLHDGAATQCDCWCHAARAALGAARAASTQQQTAAGGSARRHQPPRTPAGKGRGTRPRA